LKSVAELNAVKEAALKKMNAHTRVRVGMATCGMTAGAKPVLEEFKKQIAAKNVDAEAIMVGCLGMCKLEPIVEIVKPDGEVVTYIEMTVDKVAKIVDEHLIGGKPVDDYVIGTVEK
jgi:NADP-reducing hydrogenase subunit HndB